MTPSRTAVADGRSCASEDGDALVTPTTSPTPPGRLLSLDAFRGAVMLLLVSNGFGLASLGAYPSWRWLADQVEHAPWAGLTAWDLIQPAFTFMVGVAMPLAFARRQAAGASFRDLARHVSTRAVILVLLSNLFSNFGEDRVRFELINVLSQIALGYVICFLVLQLPVRWQAACGAALLLGHWALFVAFPGTDGPFSAHGNVGAVVDRWWLGRNYGGGYVTLNFLGNAVTILAGCWTGLWVSSRHTRSAVLRGLLVAAVASLTVGLALAPVNPVIKRLWTASFTCISTAAVLAMLAAFYWIVEVRNHRRWTFPFVVVGMNSIFIYAFWQLLAGWLDHGLATFTGRFAWLGAAGEIPQRIVVVAAMWGLCYWLYRRKIFLRV
jgi:predicted acyltransferase